MEVLRRLLRCFVHPRTHVPRHQNSDSWQSVRTCLGGLQLPLLSSKVLLVANRSAQLWCWISPTWDFLRIMTLYAIVWIAILAAFVIYCLAIRKVWRNWHELTGIFNPFNEDPFTGVIVTEIEITHQSRLTDDSRPSHGNLEGQTHDFPERKSSDIRGYSVNVQAQPPLDIERQPSIILDPFTGVRSWTRNAALQETNPEAWLYARVAFLFFCALLISWVR